MTAFLLLGCGNTGERVARRLLDRSAPVHATVRQPSRLVHLSGQGAQVFRLDSGDPGSVRELQRRVAAVGHGWRVLWSIPTLPAGNAESTARVLEALGTAPERIVYLSSTAVYGEVADVDERTAPAAGDSAGRLRLETEQAIAQGPWSTLVLRPAAIYGPHRGVHVFLRRGTAGRVPDPDRLVSRVQVDDLAAVTEAALLSDATGAFPVADEEPATTREVAAFCRQLGLPGLEARGGPVAPSGPPRGRRVDGRAIRSLLGVPWRHPSYRSGIPAALEEERGGG